MSNSEVISTNENEVVYSKANSLEILSILKEINHRWTVFRLREDAFQILEQLSENLSPEYFAQVGFMCDKNDLIEFESNTNSLKVKKYNSSGELFEDINFTYNFDINNEWKQYIPKSMHEENLKLLKEIKASDVYSLVDSDNNLQTMIATFPSSNCLQEDITQIGWVWINPKADKDTKDQIKNKLTNWLKTHADRYQAGIHLKNIASQRFFKKLGFKPECVHIYKR